MAQTIHEINARELDPASFRERVAQSCRPVVLRGLVAGWPVLRAAQQSPASLRHYLARFDAGREVEVFLGDPSIEGKYYYSAGLRGFNFDRRMMRLLDALDHSLQALGHPGSRSVYIGSVPASECLPGFAADNPMPLGPFGTAPRIWLGTPANIPSHYDTFDNLACVVAGRRRFTLYSPELIGSLYVGPLDNTMSGPPVSLAASAARGTEGEFPRFLQISDQALAVDLEPGDALYLPKLWWHQVESTAPFNALVNYWWDEFSSGPDAPYTALLLAMITIAERPAGEREAWKAFFDHYVFRTGGHPLAHLPPDQHGLLGPLKDNYSRIRARIMRMLRGA